MACRNRMLVVLAVCITLATGRAARTEEKPTKDILETAATAGQFKTFTGALEKAGLAETLKGKGPITVFAPTDKAFAKVPKDKLDALLADKDQLTKILTTHIMVGKEVKAADIRKLGGEKVNGFAVDTAEGIKIGPAKLIKADIATTNGIIHVMDAVFLPGEPEKQPKPSAGPR